VAVLPMLGVYFRFRGIADMVTFSPDPNNPQGLKMINQVDIAWNEEWANTC
jgi:hypothetical protein